VRLEGLGKLKKMILWRIAALQLVAQSLNQLRNANILHEQTGLVNFPCCSKNILCCQIQAVETSSWTVTPMTTGACPITQQFWLVLMAVGRRQPYMQSPMNLAAR
jgi:hypothetical protein